VFLEVIADRPGQARVEALNALLDWWSYFVPDPGFENYDDPAHGPVKVCQAIEERVRAAADMLREVAMDHSDGGRHRPAVRELLRNLDDGWVAGGG
jgi:hypothetical protein